MSEVRSFAFTAAIRHVICRSAKESVCEPASRCLFDSSPGRAMAGLNLRVRGGWVSIGNPFSRSYVLL